MAAYTLQLVSSVLFAYLAERCRDRSPLTRGGKRLPLFAFTLLVLLSFQLLAGFRYDIGTDYINYCIIYSDVYSYGLGYGALRGLEPGFLLLCKALSYFTAQPFAMFFVAALITNSAIVLGMRRRSERFWISCLVFILSFYYYTTFNMVRQGIAMAIMFAATGFLTRRNPAKYMLCAALASLFHYSAIVMIPAYFIVTKPAWSRYTLVAAVAVAVLFLAFNRAGELLPEGSRYVSPVSYGVSFARLAVTLGPLVPAYIWRKQLRKRAEHYDITVNMYTIACLIIISSLKSVYFSRFAVYFGLYLVLLVPMYLKIGSRTKGAAVTSAVLAFLGVYYCVQLLAVNVETANLLPYETIFVLPGNWNIADIVFTR